ncbi:unnamed protein product [Brassica oleracea var. botrytis]|uniref:NYN domain-containing protein n=2 Tax=Brassica TaxID=3705 RepID=A0A0D3BYG6_BRAOL|nr:PREDICTED: uncharacterized protein LOC106340535 [Brassica oleracea var. oleracea]KAG2287101.1 hypothetical protein Bca52824_046705 [Brassica carinata]
MSIKRTSRQDGRFIRAKTIAFWDINACQKPDGLGAGVISESVNQTLMNMNYYGELCLRLYGDTDMDKLVPTNHTFDFCGLPHTTILEQILVDLYGDTLFNRGTPINMLLIVGDLSKDKAIIDAFSLLYVSHQLLRQQYSPLKFSFHLGKKLLTVLLRFVKRRRKRE